MKKNITNYIYTETFVSELNNLKEKDLIKIFNEKYFKTIIKMEKSTLKDYNIL